MVTGAVFLACALFSLFFSASSYAHSVFVFAYPQGDEICTESYFSKEVRVRQSTIHMLDASGKELAQGTTDDNGNYCFKAPPGDGDLTFVVDAGVGHKGEFIYRTSERNAPGSGS
jgi:nickel transport protein